MALSLTSIGDNVAVSGQLFLPDIEELAQKGIRSIINNRPDGEGGSSQPLSETLRAAAEAAGLFYTYLPIPSERFDAAAVSHMRALVGELPKPLVAFCRTGARSAKLYAAASQKPQTCCDSSG